MPHSFGYRAHTRDLFQKKFRKHGTLPTQTFLKTFKVGQIVDLAGDGGVHKGMYQWLAQPKPTRSTNGARRQSIRFTAGVRRLIACGCSQRLLIRGCVCGDV